jgi:hypothetical protein
VNELAAVPVAEVHGDDVRRKPRTLSAYQPKECRVAV